MVAVIIVLVTLAPLLLLVFGLCYIAAKEDEYQERWLRSLDESIDERHNRKSENQGDDDDGEDPG